MRTINVNSKTITLGRQMEDNATQVIFDLSPYIELWGDGEVELVHTRHDDTGPYAVATVERVDDTLVWTVSDTDTAFRGDGRAEIRWIVDDTDTLGKSIIYTTKVLKSETGDITIPSALQSWYDAMIAYIDAHSIDESTIAQAITDYLAEHPIESAVTSVNNQTGAVTLTASDIGAVSTSDLTTAVESALETAKESGEFDGADGQDGQDGQDGADGADGNGIASAVLNADYTLTLTFTDGTSYTTPSIRGAQGEQGIQGETGATGATGAQGEKGDKGDKGDTGDTYTLTSADKQEIAGMVSIPVATTSNDGLMSAEMVTQLDACYTDYTAMLALI